MMNGKSSFLVCFSLWIFFLLLLNHVNAEYRDEPRKNANLSPFEGWRSAYFCLLNTSESCSKAGFTLGLDGALIVQASDIDHFCNDGCYQHTSLVLDCIQDVKSNFFFQTKQPVTYVRDVTKAACDNHTGFNTNVTKKAS